MDTNILLEELCANTGYSVKSGIESIAAKLIGELSNHDNICDLARSCPKIQLLQKLFHCLQLQETKPISVACKEMVKNILDSICFPLLKRIYPSFDRRKEVMILLGKTCTLVSGIISLDQDLITDLIPICLQSIEIFNLEKPTASDNVHNLEMMDIYSVLELLLHVFTTCTMGDLTTSEKFREQVTQLLSRLSEAIQVMDQDLVGNLAVPVIVKLLKLDEYTMSENLANLWKQVQDIAQDTSVLNTKHFLVLCGLANYFFPVGGVPDRLDLRTIREFWIMVQLGLPSKNPVNRKRAMYLLKRIVDMSVQSGADINDMPNCKEYPLFWWRKAHETKLSKVWENFILLLETLEEKQVHVIKPLLPRMSSLIKATMATQAEPQLLHTSWLSVIFTRSFFHESVQIIRWSAETVLSLDLQKCPMLTQGQDQFLYGSMLLSLQEPKLFVREMNSSVGASPVVADALEHFFQSCWEALADNNKRAEFFCQLFTHICLSNWSPVPLVFVCKGLTAVPCSPLLGREALLNLREMMIGYLCSVDTYFRASIQSFSAQFIINLISLDKCGPEDLASVLTIFKQDESFQRGTTLWSNYVQWLKEASESECTLWTACKIKSMIDRSVTAYLNAQIDSKFTPEDEVIALQIARFLLLASDAAIATTSEEEEPCLLETVTGSLVTIINSINSHVYMPVCKADKAVQLLSTLATELTLKGFEDGSPTAVILRKSLCDCHSELEMFLCRQVTEGITMLSDMPALNLYLSVTQLLLKTSGTVGGNLDKLIIVCIRTLKGLQGKEKKSVESRMCQLAATCFLGVTAEILSEISFQYPINPDHAKQLKAAMCTFVPDLEIDLCFSKPTEDGQDNSISKNEWGKIASLFLRSQWQLLQLALESGEMLRPVLDVLDLCLETLSIGSKETCLPVFNCLKIIIPKLLDSDETEKVVQTFNAMWSRLQEEYRQQFYWLLLTAFCAAVFQSACLACSESSQVLKRLKELAERLMEIGAEKTGVANALVTQLLTSLQEPGMLDHAVKFLSLLKSIAMFGGLHNKAERQWQDACFHIESLKEKCAVNEIRPGIAKRDLLVRVALINFLCKLNPSHESHCNLATSLCHIILKTCKEISETTIQTISNTLSHRRKHRLVQILLLLESFFSEDAAKEIYPILWSSIIEEYQPSVRNMFEWMVFSLASRYPSLVKDIWDLFTKCRNKRSVVICSLLCSISHVGPYLTPDLQVNFYNEAFAHVLPLTMAHHYNIRIFAQATLVKLWWQCEELKLESVWQTHMVIRHCMDFSQSNNNSNKNVRKLLENFFFQILDFKRDFSIETLFHTFPCLTCLSDEDWILPSLFSHADPSWLDESSYHFVPLYNERPDLKVCEPGPWRLKSQNAHMYADEDALEDVEDEGVDDVEGDVQKKIMPWKVMVPDEETTLELEHGIKTLEMEGLVVVTSLIDKTPNLGGLCRTSEIFGVSEFVLGKLSYTEDKAFQSLSVTAHKWLNITEVYETKIPEYLQQKRLEGYTLVGVEQTANSVCLTDYQFPQKTLLLLGNEREGIPVQLISLLDVCVEIPQQGVIRSLNVHVSGALLIWEYRRQQIMKGSR
ncbi:hypothetical protein ACJMK2_037153 [Sinanodonta woodiana]|uniref:tRNA (guanosine(18)-2'-O)-methyltransferase TARBP1 n=1 Tax=Sinanodonta woodiana TaxID=1069815 RepID=A0ABD3WNN5_SINWO